MLCLLVPTVGSFYPLPVAPIRYFPYYFFAYMLVGVCWLAIVSRRNAGVLSAIEIDLEATIDAHDSTDETLLQAHSSQDMQQRTESSAEGIADRAT